MSIAITELQNIKLGHDSKGIIILPSNFDEDAANHQYHSNSLSFFKYARDKLDLHYLTEPTKLLEQRSGDWFAPIMLVSQQLMTENPIIVGVMCGVIANYITDAFKGARAPNVNLKIICEKKSKSSKYIEISYKGDVKGLDSLQAAVKKAVEND